MKQTLISLFVRGQMTGILDNGKHVYLYPQKNPIQIVKPNESTSPVTSSADWMIEDNIRSLSFKYALNGILGPTQYRCSAEKFVTKWCEFHGFELCVPKKLNPINIQTLISEQINDIATDIWKELTGNEPGWTIDDEPDHPYIPNVVDSITIRN